MFAKFGTAIAIAWWIAVSGLCAWLAIAWLSRHAITTVQSFDGVGFTYTLQIKRNP